MKFERGDLIFIVAILIVCALATWFQHNMTHPLGPGYQDLPKDARTAQVPMKEIQAKVKVYDKPAVSEKLKLPESVKQDVSKQILAAAEVPPYRGNTSVVAVLDTSSGATSLIAKQEPLPLFGFEDEKALGIRYALLQGDPAGSPLEIYGRWTCFRIGNFYNAARISTINNGQISVESEYRW